MDFIYNPRESRTTELLQYLVEKKINNANRLFEECRSYPLGPEDKKVVALKYINNLFNIKNDYCNEVTGLDSYTRELVLNTMVKYNLSSVEVKSYIENSIEASIEL